MPAQSYIGKQASVPMGGIASSMKECYTSAFGAAKTADIDIIGTPSCLYRKMNIKNNHCHYIAALPLQLLTFKVRSMMPQLFWRLALPVVR